MEASDVIEFIKKIEGASIKVWIDGGWSVDALLGKQTRKHKDLDIAIRWQDAAKLRQLLASDGFEEIEADSKWNFVLADKSGRKIDVHAFVREKNGQIVDGILYPAASLTGKGSIDRYKVDCIDPHYLVDFLAPWISKWPDKYVPAVKMLCDRYSITLPDEYNRQLQPAPQIGERHQK